MPTIELWLWIVLGIGNIPVYILVGWGLFGSWTGFFESLKYVITPDAYSWIVGDGVEDWWQSLKFGLWLVCCAIAVFGEASVIEHFFLNGPAPAP